MIFLQTEALYVVSLEEILWGGALVAITMGVHGFGMLAVIRVNHGVQRRLMARKGLIPGILPVILASWIITLVHLFEVIVWAAFFMWKGSFPNVSLSFYFALNEYTTVGSKYSLPREWRLLEGMIATAGLLAFAWSTGVLFSMAKEFQDKGLESFKLRRQKKSTD